MYVDKTHLMNFLDKYHVRNIRKYMYFYKKVDIDNQAHTVFRFDISDDDKIYLIFSDTALKNLKNEFDNPYSGIGLIMIAYAIIRVYEKSTHKIDVDFIKFRWYYEHKFTILSKIL